ncbi:MAG: NAD-dependent succinate-semialdehyde dehydrogenase [Myxococcota bacterium]
MERRTFTVCSPATGEVVARHDGHTTAEAAAMVDRAYRVWLGWQRTSFRDRSAGLVRAAELLRERRDELARTMALEMGKPVTDGRAEADKCAWVCEHYAEHAEAMLSPVEIRTDASFSGVVHRPLGVVLAVMPWNFPLWQVFRFAAPALMAGNGAVLKHASNVPGTALAIEALLRDAGLPEGLFATMLIGSDQVEDILAHPRVAAVTLTGSTEAGRAVATQAGACLKKAVLELGGSDPYVVLADADLDEAARICADSRLVNSGQSCIAAKRFVVVADVYDAFLERFVAEMSGRVVGDPLSDDTEIGPQARVDLRDALHRQSRETQIRGARCLLGGDEPEGPGAFYPPTVLADVPRGTPGYCQELFGPVASVIRAHSEAHALEIANDTVFGLGAAVFTADPERGRALAEEHLDAGCCFVNGMVKSDPRLPFGGIKESGYGRELSTLGIREFVNQKTVWVA